MGIRPHARRSRTAETGQRRREEDFSLFLPVSLLRFFEFGEGGGKGLNRSILHARFLLPFLFLSPAGERIKKKEGKEKDGQEKNAFLCLLCVFP